MPGRGVRGALRQETKGTETKGRGKGARRLSMMFSFRRSNTGGITKTKKNAPRWERKKDMTKRQK